MSTFWRDLRHAAWLLVQQPGFTLVALLTLALAIGANTAIFSVVRGVLLKPLPFPEPDRLVLLYNSYPGVGVEFGANGVPDYLDRREETAVFSGVALIANDSYNLGAEGSPERVGGIRVTPSFFPVMGTPPALGRAFTEEDATLGNESRAILTWDLWRRLYGGDPGALGGEIRVNGEPYEIVGVMPEGFRFLNRDVELLAPFAFTEEQKSDDARHSNFALMVARLAPGVGVPRAQAQIDDLNRRNAERFPQYVELLESVNFHTVVTDLHGKMVEDVRPALLLLQVGVAVVLLIGCVNVANLLLVRANGRMKELAVRLALGAGRRRLARQLLTESVLLGVVGGLGGLLVGAAGVRLFSRLGLERLPRGGEVEIDGAVLAFTLAVAVGTGLLFGLLPVAKVLRTDLNDVFRQSGRTGSAGRGAALTRAGLVALQVALAFVLLIAAGLTLASFLEVLAIRPGFEPDRVLTARLALPDERYREDADVRAFASRLLPAIDSLPGVEAAALTSFLPFGGDSNASVISIEGRTLAPGEKPPVPHFSSVDPRYFRALGIPLLRGRSFDQGDGAEATPVAVVDRDLAERYWPGEDPIGRRILRGLPEEPNDSPWYTVVGVVGAIKTAGLAEPDTVGTVYFSAQQLPARGLALVVKGAIPEERLVAAVRGEVLRIDPELPLFDVKSMGTRVAESLADRRAPTVLLAVFAAVALLLSAIGVYGVLAYAVRERTREIGIRVALGARREQVLRQVLGHGARIVLVGLAVGLAFAVAVTRAMASQLYGIGPTDPRVFTAVALTLAAAALAACLVPSLRATRVDPNHALRYE
jgi:predicted permease